MSIDVSGIDSNCRVKTGERFLAAVKADHGDPKI
jgi:hypothetical protein